MSFKSFHSKHLITVWALNLIFNAHPPCFGQLSSKGLLNFLCILSFKINYALINSDGRYINTVIDTRDILHYRYNIKSRNEKRGFRYDNHAYLLQLIN